MIKLLWISFIRMFVGGILLSALIWLLVVVWTPIPKNTTWYINVYHWDKSSETITYQGTVYANFSDKHTSDAKFELWTTDDDHNTCLSRDVRDFHITRKHINLNIK